jgi:hypothetical protein
MKYLIKILIINAVVWDVVVVFVAIFVLSYVSALTSLSADRSNKNLMIFLRIISPENKKALIKNKIIILSTSNLFNSIISINLIIILLKFLWS